MKLYDGEILIKKGAANHLNQSEGVGGRLFLTNQRLFFKSHFFNIQAHEKAILLKDIISIEANSGGLFFRMISILLKNGSVERFVVRGRKIWADKINNAIGNRHGKKLDYKMPQISYRVIVVQAIIITFCTAAIIFILLMLK